MKTSMFYLFHLFRSFLPLHNPIGFGASDFVELALAVSILVCALSSAEVVTWTRQFASSTLACMILLGILPIALRLALLAAHPIPTPQVLDDFSYLLLGDTLTHFRFANPTHPLHQFFETLFVLQQPTYSSIYPPGQGIALAIGKLLCGNPWAGVALSIGAFCALCYWMLRAWISPGWALLGGVLAAIEFGPLSQWMNSFWGGGVSACAGCLVFGALPRLRERGRIRDAIFLGAGLGIQVLCRPYESSFLLAAVAIYFLPALKDRAELRRLARVIPIGALATLPALGLMLIQNKQVSGSFATMPYMVSRYQYGLPTTFTVQQVPTPHRALTPEQQLGYEVQSAEHGSQPETLATYFARLVKRVRFYRFFFLAPLYLAFPAALFLLVERKYQFVFAIVCLFALGTTFYPYFYSHYIAAIACLLILLSVAALQRLDRWTIRGYPAGRDAARAILFLCFAHFAFWYGLHAAGNQDFARDMWRYESWDAINSGDPEGRIAIHQELSAMPGKQLVFVQYSPQHPFQEWIYNAADIDSSKIVWARNLGEQENEKLLHYYPDRKPWMLYPDARPVRLIPYEQQAPATELSSPETKTTAPSAKPGLHFEEVH
jgi:hypothetical protein